MSGSAANMRVAVTITGDGQPLKQAAAGAQEDLDKIGRAGTEAGRQASGGLVLIQEAASRLLPLLGIAGVGGALLAIARSGDEMTRTMGRLTAATGSIAQATETYRELYAISLQTGVAVNESAGAFARFAIAAREIGATREQSAQLVRLIQQAGAVAGASAQETASATLQLGQALASGRFQGDELRSVMGSMPTLIEALARELGVSVGELRRMGEEGRLTAEVVFPALLRAGEQIGREFAQLPTTMERSLSQLGIASRQFLADLDRALGLSQAIARALGREGVAGNLDTMRRELRLGSAVETAEIEVRNLRENLIAARRSNGRNDEAGLHEGSVQQAERRLQEAERRLAELREQARAADATAAEQAAAQAAQRTRDGHLRDFQALQEHLDRRLRLHREFAEREGVIRNAEMSGVITPAQAEQARTQAQRDFEDRLRALNQPQGGRGERLPTPPAFVSPDQIGEDPALRNQRQQIELLREQRRLQDASAQARVTELAALRERQAIEREGADTESANSRARIEQARRIAALDLETRRAQDALDEIGRIGERAFDRIGGAITEGIVQGRVGFNSLRSVGLAVASELAQAFLRLALLNPIRNAITGSAATTLIDVVGRFAPSLAGAAAGPAPLPIDASAGGFLFHTGGVVGRDAAPRRDVPLTLFANAPRLHSGGYIGQDEVPAILQRGEGVFTPEQMAALGPAGGRVFAPTINFSGNAGSAEDRETLIQGLRSLWLQDLAGATPAIVQAAKAAIVGDVQRRGYNRVFA